VGHLEQEGVVDVTVKETLDALLGDQRADLIAAAREAMDRRERNTLLGGLVIAALHEDRGEKSSRPPRFPAPPRSAGPNHPGGTP
jgi:hypothetical protein